MSFIRSTSNPEHLYIFGSKNGLEIYCPDIPMGIIVDQNRFFNFVKEWNKNDYPEVFYCDGIRLIEENRGSGFRIYIRIDNEPELRMYYVTWMYIVHNILERITDG